uniref:Stomatin-like 3 n=1 Tax=Xenopus tropicalis TaxID=8364 RepID=A0A803K2M4_XENTR
METQMESQFSQKRQSREELIEAADGNIGVCGWIILILSAFMAAITFPLSIWFCVKIIQEYERAVVFRLGRIISGKAKGPGVMFVLPCTDTFIKVDLRVISFAIPPQEILTKDSVTTTVDGVVYYNIQSAIKAVANVNNVHIATQQLAQTTLRNILGTQTLANILANREEIAHNIQSILDHATHKWGVKVDRVEMRDVRLPVQMQRAMAAEAEAAREARAKVNSPWWAQRSQHLGTSGLFITLMKFEIYRTVGGRDALNWSLLSRIWIWPNPSVWPCQIQMLKIA